MRLSTFPVLGLFIAVTWAQTQTVVDELGQTVVEFVTTDIDGDPSTLTLQTLTGALTTTTTGLDDEVTTTATRTTATTTAVEGGGQVGAPPATTGTPHAPIPYQYTTTIAGVETVIEDIFTPTFPATTPTTAPATGSIMAFSDYLAQISTTASSGSSGNAATSLISEGALRALGGALVACILSGLTTLL